MVRLNFALLTGTGMSYKAVTQNPRELEAFLDWIEVSRINVYLEIGLYAGATFKAVYDRLMKVWDNDTSKFLVFGIDMPTNKEAWKVCTDTLQNTPSVRVWWTSSTDKDTVEDVLRGVRLFQTEHGSEYHGTELCQSLVFIDGDHNYAQVKDDYMAYEKAFNYVAFNDISPGTVAQNKAKFDGREIASGYHFYDALKVSNGVDEVAYWDMPDQGKYRGIGVLS